MSHMLKKMTKQNALFGLKKELLYRSCFIVVAPVYLEEDKPSFFLDVRDELSAVSRIRAKHVVRGGSAACLSVVARRA